MHWVVDGLIKCWIILQQLYNKNGNKRQKKLIVKLYIDIGEITYTQISKLIYICIENVNAMIILDQKKHYT